MELGNEGHLSHISIGAESVADRHSKMTQHDGNETITES